MHEHSTETKRERSRERTKISLSRIGWATGKATAGLVPGGSLAVDVIETAVEHVRRYREDRVKERLSHFAKCILESAEGEELNHLLGREFEQSDFHAILTALVNDEEDEKAEIYAHTLKALINGEVRQENRRHVIRTISVMSWSDLELSRKIYIHSHFAFPTYNAFPADLHKQVSQLLETKDTMKLVAIRALVSQGLLFDSMPTELLDAVVKAAYAPEHLVPSAIGLRERSPIADILGVYFALFIEEDDTHLITKLSEELFRAEIKNVIVNPAATHNRPDLSLKMANVIAICISRSGSPTSAISQIVDLAKRAVAVILLPRSTDDPNIERAYTLDLRDNRVEMFSSFIHWAHEYILEPHYPNK